MRKHIKRLHFQCNANLGIDGEYTPSKSIFCHLNKDMNGTEHNYNIEIYPSINSGYRLSVYLAMTASNAHDILTYSEKYDKRKEAEIDAVRVVLELEQCNLSEEINEWKKCNVSPVFNSEIEHVGDVYTSFNVLKKDRKSFDYYNSNPIESLYGKFYTLEKFDNKPCYSVINSNYDSTSCRSGKDQELLDKMLSKLNKKKYERFFE